MTTANTVTGTALVERRRARYRTYSASPKGQARLKKYFATPKGRAALRRKNAKGNAKRLMIGRLYVGRARTQEDAAAIQRHIKDRLHEFVEGQQGRAAVEAVSAVGVPAETGHRAHQLGRGRADSGNRGTKSQQVTAADSKQRGIRHYGD